MVGASQTSSIEQVRITVIDPQIGPRTDMPVVVLRRSSAEDAALEQLVSVETTDACGVFVTDRPFHWEPEWTTVLRVCSSPTSFAELQLRPGRAISDQLLLSDHCSTFSNDVLIEGRINDHEFRPFANRRCLLRWYARERSRILNKAFEALVSTDNNGRFEFRIPLERGSICISNIRVDSLEESEHRETESYATIGVPVALTRGRFDIGAVMLSPKAALFEMLSDDDILGRHCMLEDPTDSIREGSLTQIVPQDDARWQSALKARVHPDDTRTTVVDLPSLIALRRIQRLPDPVAIEVDGAPSFTAVGPLLPTLKCHLRNLDVENETIRVSIGLGEVRIECLPEDGIVVHHKPAPEAIAAAGVSYDLGPESAVANVGVDLNDYLEVEGTGICKFRLCYDGSPTLQWVDRPRISCSTPWYELRKTSADQAND